MPTLNPTRTTDRKWRRLRGSTVIDKCNIKTAVPGTPVFDRVKQLLGYDMMLAEGARRFAADDAVMAENDLAAQADNLEPYDE
jgi:hypothetical protein